jgi:hypothetical protein
MRCLRNGLKYAGGTSKSLDTGATGLHKPEIHYGYIKIIKEYVVQETRAEPLADVYCRVTVRLQVFLARNLVFRI